MTKIKQEGYEITRKYSSQYIVTPELLSLLFGFFVIFGSFVIFVTRPWAVTAKDDD